jgi:hypothetical protein
MVVLAVGFMVGAALARRSDRRFPGVGRPTNPGMAPGSADLRRRSRRATHASACRSPNTHNCSVLLSFTSLTLVMSRARSWTRGPRVQPRIVSTIAEDRSRVSPVGTHPADDCPVRSRRAFPCGVGTLFRTDLCSVRGWPIGKRSLGCGTASESRTRAAESSTSPNLNAIAEMAKQLAEGPEGNTGGRSGRISIPHFREPRLYHPGSRACGNPWP